MNIPMCVTEQQVSDALAVLGLEALQVRSLQIVASGEHRSVMVDFVPIPIVRSEASTTEEGQ